MNPRPVRILCLGNELARDDGIGIRVGRVLRELTLPDSVRVELRRCVGMELVDELHSGEDLVVVDASMTGGAAGSCTTTQIAGIELLAETPYCCHGVGIEELLVLAARMAPDRIPERTVLVSVEAGVVSEFGTELSPAVRAALPEAVRVVLELIGADAGTFAVAAEASVRAQLHDPTPLSVCEDHGGSRRS